MARLRKDCNDGVISLEETFHTAEDRGRWRSTLKLSRRTTVSSPKMKKKKKKKKKKEEKEEEERRRRRKRRRRI